MTWVYTRSTRMLGILVAASGLMACDVSDVSDVEDEELLDEELRPQGHHVVTLGAEADTYIRTDVNIRRNDNYGCQDFMEVGTGRRGNLRPEGAPDAMRSLVRFDLSGIDVDTVTSARLLLSLSHFDHGSDDSVYQVDAHRVLPSGHYPLPSGPPWVEGNGLESGSASSEVPAGCTDPDRAFGVAWRGGPDPLNRLQSRRFGRNNQTQPPFDPAVVGSVRIAQDEHAPGDMLEIDVTDLVEDWLSGAPNEGILLRDVTTDGGFRGVAFGTHEGEMAGGVAGPRLVITTVPVFPEVEITALDLRTRLRWNPRSGATYSVYRGNRPNFNYTDSNAQIVVSGLTEGEYTETMGPYDPGAYYQVVEDVSGSKAPSAVLGRLPIPVWRSPSSPYSKIPLCFVPSPDDAYQQMLLHEHPSTIHWWDPIAQRFEFESAPFESVLDLEVSEHFAVRHPAAASAFFPYHITGRVPEEDDLSLAMNEGIHAVAWPVTAERTKASELLIPFLGLVAVGRWNLTEQRVEWYRTPDRPVMFVPGVANVVTTIDFEIEPCTPLYVYIDELFVIDGFEVPVPWPISAK